LVNGERLCEAELFATVLAAFHVPVGFFSGCPVACREVARKMPWLVTHEIAKDPEIYGDEKKRGEYILQKRQGLSTRVKEMVHPEQNPLFAMKPPFDCRVVFHQEDEARRMNSWNFPREGKVLRFQTEQFLELYQNLIKIAYFPKLAFQLRALVLPLTRLVWKIHSLKHL
jgi:D-aminopeptidase